MGKFSKHQPTLAGESNAIPIPNPPDPTRPAIPAIPPPANPPRSDGYFCPVCFGVGFHYSIQRDNSIERRDCQYCEGAGDMLLVACAPRANPLSRHFWFPTSNLSQQCTRCGKTAVAIRREPMENLLKTSTSSHESETSRISTASPSDKTPMSSESQRVNSPESIRESTTPPSSPS